MMKRPQSDAEGKKMNVVVNQQENYEEAAVRGEAAATQHENPNRTSKLPSERVVLLVLGSLLAAAFIIFYRLSFVMWETNQRFQTLKEENEALRRNLSGSEIITATQERYSPPDSGDTCLKNRPGWERHWEKCYYFNLMPLLWNESREECRCRGGDLVKIESKEEQMFLKEKLKKKILHNEDKFWIGLTDSEKEGRWVWVDGSLLKESLSFWYHPEPDNWTKANSNGEDCVRMGRKEAADDLNCWYDQSCLDLHKSICEKAAGIGTGSSACV